MKWSFASIGVIILGIIGVSIIFLFQSITTSNENDYYLLKEVTEAAMIEAVDIPYYRETGDLKINREKFVENFARRFAESTIFVSNDYTIKSYDIMETPPKVSIVIETGLGEYTIGGNADDYGISNKLDAILEYVGDKTYSDSSVNPYVDKMYSNTYYAIPAATNDGFNVMHSLKIPGKLVAPNIKDVKIKEVSYIGIVDSQEELNEALLKRELSFNINSNSNYMQSIDEFVSSVSINNISYYNCGISTNKYKCDDVNKYYVDINGSADGDKAIFKYKVIWSYKEYEFSN